MGREAFTFTGALTTHVRLQVSSLVPQLTTSTAKHTQPLELFSPNITTNHTEINTGSGSGSGSGQLSARSRVVATHIQQRNSESGLLTSVAASGLLGRNALLTRKPLFATMISTQLDEHICDGGMAPPTLLSHEAIKRNAHYTKAQWLLDLGMYPKRA